MAELIALNLMDPQTLAAAGAEPSALYSGFRTFKLGRT
jgi:hypothetical protein